MPLSVDPAILEHTVDLVAELTAVSSPSGDAAGLATVAAALARAFASRGLQTEVRDEPAAGARLPTLVARGRRAAGGKPLVLAGHLDTVLPAVVPSRRDGRLYATGAIDMKGGLGAVAGALDVLAAHGRQPPPDLLIVVAPDEEVSGELSFAAMRHFGAEARALWVLEPGQPRGEAETVVCGRRGMIHWRVDVAGRSAHAGNGFWEGRSALLAAADWCLEARKLAEPGRGPTVNPARLLAGEAGFLENLAAEAAIVGSGRQINVVPDRASIEGEARFLGRADGERLAKELKRASSRVAERHGLEIRFETTHAVAPFEPRGPGRRTADLAVRLAAERGFRLEVEEDRAGLSFPNFLPDPNAVAILDGLGPVGGGMHTRDEHLEIASLERRIGLLADLLAAESDSEA